MSKLFHCCAFAVLALMTSCQKQSGVAESYFDSLVVSQATVLASSEAKLTKRASLGKEKDEVTFTPDKARWESELDIFRQLRAFEKPAYRSDYTIEDNIKDSGSNLTVRSYFSQKQIPVPQLRFYYYQTIHNLKKIEAVFQEKNALFSTSRRLSLEFDDSSGRPEIRAYSVSGNQKMIGSDSVHFSISSTIGH